MFTDTLVAKLIDLLFQLNNTLIMKSADSHSKLQKKLEMEKWQKQGDYVIFYVIGLREICYTSYKSRTSS